MHAKETCHRAERRRRQKTPHVYTRVEIVEESRRLGPTNCEAGLGHVTCWQGEHVAGLRCTCDIHSQYQSRVARSRARSRKDAAWRHRLCTVRVDAAERAGAKGFADASWLAPLDRSGRRTEACIASCLRTGASVSCAPIRRLWTVSRDVRGVYRGPVGELTVSRGASSMHSRLWAPREGGHCWPGSRR